MPTPVTGGIVALVVVLLLLLFWLAYRASVAGWTTRLQSGCFPVPYYFDNNGTTPLCVPAQRAWQAALCLGNASAAYASAAKQVLKDARAQIQQWLGAPFTVLFTSGGSESNNLVLRGLPWEHLVLGSTEHSTSLDCAAQFTGRAVHLLPAEPDGRVAPATLAAALRGIAPSATVLVSIMHGNNETGALNDLAALHDVCQARGAIFHTDAVQTFGKYPDLAQHCDALSASFHKLGGPLGVGLLALRPSVAARLQAQIAGTQQDGLRGGTENVPGIAAASAALRFAITDRAAKNARQTALRTQFLDGLRALYPFAPFATYMGKSDAEVGQMIANQKVPVHVVLITDVTAALPGTVLFSIVKNRDPHFCNIALRDRLLGYGIAVSIGSACSTAKTGPSHVLLALGAPFFVRCGVLRVSFGDANTPEEVCYLLERLAQAITEQL